jgi:RNA polymerase sigma-70 factor (ECF subfamily)
MDQRLIEDEMNTCIRNVIDGLPESYRAVLTLSEFEDFKNREIAEILGITLESVKINLHRARSRLRKALEHQCEFYRTDKSELACEPAKPRPEKRK